MPTGGGTGGTGGSTGPSGTGFGYWDPGGCNCPVTSIQIVGCSALGYSGLTVSIYTSNGGTLLFSGTTDGGGFVYPGIAPGTWYTTITGQSARFKSFGQNVTFFPGANLPIGPGPAIGYYCVDGCLQPTTGTLHYTGPLGALALLVSAGGSWSDGSNVVTFYGDTNPPSLTESGLPNPTLSSETCPPSPSWSYSDGSTVTE